MFINGFLNHKPFLRIDYSTLFFSVYDLKSNGFWLRSEKKNDCKSSHFIKHRKYKIDVCFFSHWWGALYGCQVKEKSCYTFFDHYTTTILASLRQRFLYRRWLFKGKKGIFDSTDFLEISEIFVGFQSKKHPLLSWILEIRVPYYPEESRVYNKNLQIWDLSLLSLNQFQDVEIKILHTFSMKNKTSSFDTIFRLLWLYSQNSHWVFMNSIS